MIWDVRHGDCLTMLADLPADAVIVSDPPYGTGWLRTAPGSALGEFAGVHEQPEWDVWSTEWLEVGQRVARGGAFLLPRSQIASVVAAVRDVRFAFYVKSNPRPRGPMVEPVAFWGVMSASLGDIRAYNGDTPLHPCQKPIEVMEWMLASVPDGALVVDPFCGSGTTGVAAIRLGHRFLGIEREERYVKIARERIAAAAAQTTLDLEAA